MNNKRIKKNETKRKVSSENIHFRTTSSRKKKLQKASDELGISMSEFMEQAIDEKMESRKGCIKPKGKIPSDVRRYIEEANIACEVWSFRRKYKVSDECNELFDKIIEKGKMIWDYIL